jgi:hypothetical protein
MTKLKNFVSMQLKKSIIGLKNRLFWPYRQATWKNRALPDFIIIGAMKSGTSSLFAYLSQHPQLHPSWKKEIHFFDGGLDPNIDSFEMGQAWYRAHFPLREKMSRDSKTFEASPLYIFNPLAPKRIFNLLPEVKIIALFRNPTERAISHYFHEKSNNREPLSIYEALKIEENRLETAISKQDFKSRIFIDFSYKRRGHYKEQIERYLDLFSWQRILILSSEDLFSQPDASLRRVFDFVEVDTEFKVKKLRSRNVTRIVGEVDPYVYDYLNTYFLPHNQALYELVGKSYNW